MENEDEFSDDEMHTYRYEPLCKEISIKEAHTPAFAKSMSVVSYYQEETKNQVEESKIDEMPCVHEVTKMTGFKTEAFIKFIIRKFRETIKKNF